MKSIAGSKEPVTIQADSLRYDRKTNTYFADGNVKITQKDYTLTSEKATLNEETGDAEATGKARLVSPDNVVFADVIKVNFNTKLGVIEQGNIFVKNGNYRIKGNPLGEGRRPGIYNNRRRDLRPAKCQKPFLVRTGEIHGRPDGQGRLRHGGHFLH